MRLDIITEQGREQVRRIVLSGIQLGLLSRAEMNKRRRSGGGGRASNLGITVRYREDRNEYMRQWRRKRREQGLRA